MWKKSALVCFDFVNPLLLLFSAKLTIGSPVEFEKKIVGNGDATDGEGSINNQKATLLVVWKIATLLVVCYINRVNRYRGLTSSATVM